MTSTASSIIRHPSFEPDIVIKPNYLLSQTSIYDLSRSDSNLDHQPEEYKLIQIIRENRIIDSFVGFSCFSIPPRPRTTISEEISFVVDEVYFGTNRFGHTIAIPVIAMNVSCPLQFSIARSLFEIYQSEFSRIVCVPIVTQFVENNVFAFWTFHRTEHKFSIDSEKHYRLVRPDELSNEELASYQNHNG